MTRTAGKSFSKCRRRFERYGSDLVPARIIRFEEVARSPVRVVTPTSRNAIARCMEPRGA